MKILSIVTPCFNEKDAIPYFYQEVDKISKIMDKKLEFEIIFIDDGSTDNSLNVIKNLAKKDTRIKYISFSRNFGKEAALYAGLKKASGDFVATLDVDLQDPPNLLPQMYEFLEKEDYDCVATKRITRKGEPLVRSFFAKAFYKIINKISDTQIVDGARDYRFMKRQMVDAILNLREYNRFSKGIFSWVGFKTKWLAYENIERVAGNTKWSFGKLIFYSLEGIVGFSTAPLSIAAFLGIFFCFLAFLLICLIVFKTVVWGDPVSGYPSLVCVIMFLGGIQLFCVGVLGKYLAKTYLETKKRPIYISREEN